MSTSLFFPWLKLKIHFTLSDKQVGSDRRSFGAHVLTAHSPTLTSSCKATQPQLQIICDLGLNGSKQEPNAYRFQVLIPKHPKPHFVCSVSKNIRVFLPPSTTLSNEFFLPLDKLTLCVSLSVFKCKAECSFLITWLGLSAQQRFGFQVWLCARPLAIHTEQRQGYEAHIGLQTSLYHKNQENCPLACWSS